MARVRVRVGRRGRRIEEGVHVEGRRRVGVGVGVVVVWGSHHQIELSANSQFNLMKSNEIGEFLKKKNQKKKKIDRDWD